MDQIRLRRFHGTLQRQVQLQVNVRQSNIFLFPAQAFFFFQYYHGFTSQLVALKPSVAGKKKPTADRSAVGFL
jgi:hypothetical protein